MKKILAALSIILFTGCTPAQITAWLDWNNTDPVAAQEFANSPEIQAELHSGASRENNTTYNNSSDGPQFQTSLRWNRIAYCESGGNWHYPPVTNRTGTYSGGLMIWQKAWISYGGQQFAGWAYQATKAQQIVVAERILADNGWSAWQCK